MTVIGAALAGARVLVIEDEILVAFDLEAQLRKLGCAEVVLVPSERAARAALERGTFDAVVLDINLGRGPSYALADELIGSRIPFLFATGYGEGDMPDRYRALPRVNKPVAIGDLGPALDAVIASRR